MNISHPTAPPGTSPLTHFSHTNLYILVVGLSYKKKKMKKRTLLLLRLEPTTCWSTVNSSSPWATCPDALGRKRCWNSLLGPKLHFYLVSNPPCGLVHSIMMHTHNMKNMWDIDAFFVFFFSRSLQLDTKQIEEIELVSDVLLFCFVLFASKCDLSAVALDRDSIFILSHSKLIHTRRHCAHGSEWPLSETQLQNSYLKIFSPPFLLKHTSVKWRTVSSWDFWTIGPGGRSEHGMAVMEGRIRKKCSVFWYCCFFHETCLVFRSLFCLSALIRSSRVACVLF